MAGTRTVAAVDEETAGAPAAQDARGDASLAREMVGAYKEYVRFYRERMGKSAEDALAAAAEPASDLSLETIEKQSPDQVSWLTINAMAERDPALAREGWLRLVDTARDELASGQRAARAMEGYSHSPWARAQFLVLRESLATEWQPTNGIEWMLIDMLAQAYTAYEEALKLLMTYTTMEASLNDFHIQRNNRYETPRLTAAETLARAEQTLDRCQRAILRVQRALRDQRRYGPVIVQHAGQVNVGRQQVNVAGGAGEEERAEAARPGRRTRTPRVPAAREDADG